MGFYREFKGLVNDLGWEGILGGNLVNVKKIY